MLATATKFIFAAVSPSHLLSVLGKAETALGLASLALGQTEPALGYSNSVLGQAESVDGFSVWAIGRTDSVLRALSYCFALIRIKALSGGRLVNVRLNDW